MGPSPEEVRRRADARSGDDDVKTGAAGEHERVQAERDALISGMAAEITDLFDRFDQCKEALAAVVAEVKADKAATRSLTRKIDKVLEILTPPPIPPNC